MRDTWKETVLRLVGSGLVAGISLSILLGAIQFCRYVTVDFSQAKFEPGQVVELKLGGKAQILSRSGINEGHPWE